MFKTKEQIEEMASKAWSTDSLCSFDFPEYLYGFKEGATWMQKDLLESASEGFSQEKFDNWARENLYSIHDGCYGKKIRNNAIKLWQAAKLSSMKEIQDLETKLKEQYRFTKHHQGNASVHLETIRQKDAEIERLKKEIEHYKADNLKQESKE